MLQIKNYYYKIITRNWFPQHAEKNINQPKTGEKMSKQKLGTPLDVLLFPLLPHQAKNITNKKEKKN